MFPRISKGWKNKSNPITGLGTPWGFQKAEAPRSEDSRRMKVVRLSALSTGHLYPLRKYTWYSFLLEAESPQGSSTAGRIKSMKNSNDTIGNRTRDLPACSAMPQWTAPQRAVRRNEVPLFSKLKGSKNPHTQRGRKKTQEKRCANLKTFK